MNFKILISIMFTLFSFGFCDECLDNIKKYKSSDPLYEFNQVSSSIRHYVPGSHYEDKYQLINDTLILNFYENGALSERKAIQFKQIDSLYYFISNNGNSDSTIITSTFSQTQYNRCEFHSDNIVCTGTDISSPDTTFYYLNHQLIVGDATYNCATVNETCDCRNNKNSFYKIFGPNNYIQYNLYDGAQDSTFRFDTLTYVNNQTTNNLRISIPNKKNIRYNIKGNPVIIESEYDNIIFKEIKNSN